MGFEDFVSETEAASAAGVSVATLKRFAEAGYLHAESDSDGLRLFSKSEIKSVFGLQDAELYRAEAVDSDPKKDSEPQKDSEPKTVEKSASKIEVEIEHRHMREEPAPEPIKVREVQPEKTIEIQRPSAPKNGLGSEIVNKLERAVAKLQTITEMQEKLLLLKDERIKSLEENNNWLKSQVEKLEEKSDRDQLLLLAEAQTIRTLVAATVPRKSTLRQALEWFGLLPPTPDSPLSPRATIDMSSGTSAGTASQN